MKPITLVPAFSAGALKAAVLSVAVASAALAATAAQAQSTPESVAEASVRLKKPLAVMQAADALGMWRGVGARENLDEIVRAEFIASGVIHTPVKTGAWPKYDVKKMVFAVNYAMPASRVDMVRTDASGKEERSIQVVRGHLAWNETSPGVGATPAPGTAESRLGAIDVLPHAFMREVVEADAKLVKVGKRGGKTTISVPIDGVVATAVLGSDFRPERIEFPITHAVLGKTTVVATFSGYKDWNGYEVFFPTRIVETLGGKPWVDLTVSAHEVGPYLIWPIPANIAATAAK